MNRLLLVALAALSLTSQASAQSSSLDYDLAQQAGAIVEQTGATRQLLKQIAQSYGDNYFAAPASLQQQLTQSTQAIFQGTLNCALVNGAPTDTLGSAQASTSSLIIRRFNQSFAQSVGAVCMDGSPYAYYMRQAPATSPNSNKYVAYMEGGALCVDQVSCTERSLGPLGSSNNHLQFYDDDSGTFAIDPFKNWNQIFLPYCSGDVWGGSRTINQTSSFGLFFAGHNITQAVIADIQATSTSEITDLVLTGNSAGGIGTLLHVDSFAAAFPNSTVVGMPQAGWFTAGMTYPQWQVLTGADGTSKADRPVRDTALYPTLLPMFDVFQFALSPECASYYADKNQTSQAIYQCTSMPGLYPFIRSPLFILENRFDTFQLVFLNVIPISFTFSTLNYLIYSGNAMVRSIQSHVQAKGGIDGYYVPSCLAHNLYFNKTNYNAQINGVKPGAAFNAWWTALKSSTLTTDSASEYRWIDVDNDLPWGRCSTVFQ